jgi:hypothetical protein
MNKSVTIIGLAMLTGAALGAAAVQGLNALLSRSISGRT